MAVYTYGRQMGRAGVSKYLDLLSFKKYYPKTSSIPQRGYFCNNANSAISRKYWETYQFDEELTGLEDLQLAKRLTCLGHKIAYVADALVEHIYEENWHQIRRRFEREAAALSAFEPELSVNFLNMVKLTLTVITRDILRMKQVNPKCILETMNFRIN